MVVDMSSALDCVDDSKPPYSIDPPIANTHESPGSPFQPHHYIITIIITILFDDGDDDLLLNC